MTLSFSTKWPEGMGELTGKPNYFVEKICLSFPVERSDELDASMIENYNHYDYNADVAFNCRPKLHTIRIDPKNRWKAGMDIHPVINNRSKNRYQFAPTLKCQNVQRIEIKRGYSDDVDDATIFIDNKKICTTWFYPEAVHTCYFDHDIFSNTFFINDGFDNEKAFFDYFKSDFSGVIIHWTDIKY